MTTTKSACVHSKVLTTTKAKRKVRHTAERMADLDPPMSNRRPMGLEEGDSACLPACLTLHRMPALTCSTCTVAVGLQQVLGE